MKTTVHTKSFLKDIGINFLQVKDACVRDHEGTWREQIWKKLYQDVCSGQDKKDHGLAIGTCDDGLCRELLRPNVSTQCLQLQTMEFARDCSYAYRNVLAVYLRTLSG